MRICISSCTARGTVPRWNHSATVDKGLPSLAASSFWVRASKCDFNCSGVIYRPKAMSSARITESRFSVKERKRPRVVDVVHNRGMDLPGKRLRALRKARKLTQPQIAEATGVPQSTLSGIERGETKDPISSVLLKLAAFYEVEPHWIVTGEGPKHTVASKDDAETELLLYFRALSPEGQRYILSRARDLHTDEHRSKRQDSQARPLAGDGDDRFQ